MEIDAVDKKIINELIKNAKIPLRKLAIIAGVSFVTVLNRIKRLEKEKVILGYEARICYRELGYDIYVLIELRIGKGRLLELQRKIARNSNVCSVYDTTGQYDATIIAKFKTTKLMDAFLKKIQKYDFVEMTNTKLILNVIKEGHIMLH